MTTAKQGTKLFRQPLWHCLLHQGAWWGFELWGSQGSWKSIHNTHFNFFRSHSFPKILVCFLLLWQNNRIWILYLRKKNGPLLPTFLEVQKHGTSICLALVWDTLLNYSSNNTMVSHRQSLWKYVYVRRRGHIARPEARVWDETYSFYNGLLSPCGQHSQQPNFLPSSPAS